jgi:hypothetical protein
MNLFCTCSPVEAMDEATAEINKPTFGVAT